MKEESHDLMTVPRYRCIPVCLRRTGRRVGVHGVGDFWASSRAQPNGWSRSVPRAFADFRPQDSYLRFARAVTHTLAQDSVRVTPWRDGPPRRRWDFPRTEPMRGSPTGKRRLRPAHATGPPLCSVLALQTILPYSAAQPSGLPAFG